MVTEKWTLHCVVVGSTQINQTKEYDIDPQIAKLFEYGSGQVDPTFAAFDGESPVIRFSTTAIKRLLATINVENGQALSSGTPVDIYFQQMAPGGTRLTGATGLRVRVSAGMAVVSRITAGDGQVAVAEAMVYAVSTDGESTPIAVTANVTLPVLLATDQLYTSGPAVLGGAEIGAIESFEFDPKLSVRRNRGDGQAYATFAYMLRRGSEDDGPSIMLSTRHLGKLVSGTSFAIDAANDYVALRALKSGAPREALTALKHIKFKPNAGAVLVSRATARDGDEASLMLEVSGARTVSSAAFTITVDQALAS